MATGKSKTTTKSKKSELFWRIAISLVGIALILMAISNLLLFVLGETATAAVMTRRYGGERPGAVNDKRYTWSVDYTFIAADGITYEGHLSKLGSATSVKTSKTIYYFTFAPFINTPEDTAEPNLGQLVLLAAGVFCLYVMNRKPKVSARVKTPARAGRSSEPIITDYDDSVEEYYQQEDNMNQYCTHCGSELPAGTRFCRNCGQAADQTGPGSTAPMTAQPFAATVPQPGAGSGYATQPALVGWTTRHLDPAVLARAEKNKKSAWIFTLVLTVLFPLGFALAGALMDDMPLGEALIIGIGLGLMMLIIGLVRISRMKTGTWEGTVTDKKHKQKMDHSQSDDIVRHKTIYTIVVTEDNGKRHKLNYTDNTALYNYFNMGDRIRCHMAFSTYEKYDKSRDSSIFCNICGTLNDLTNDNCVSCRLPLFK
ncbi:MAG: zinc-ribbon domain-containing protein [Bacillota bacterium]|nr:zinc-ribbon domain-containing protein [Bacillota bacterium]